MLHFLILQELLVTTEFYFIKSNEKQNTLTSPATTFYLSQALAHSYFLRTVPYITIVI